MNEQEVYARQVALLAPLLANLVEEHEEHSHDYHLAIREFPYQPFPNSLQTYHLVEVLNLIAGDKEQKAGVRVAALATSLASLWRWRDYQQFRKVFDKYRRTFQDADSLLESLYKGMYDLSQVSSPDGFQRALDSASKAKNALPDTPGVLNLYTEVVAVIGERGGMDDMEGELEKAMLSIEEAIGTDPKYAKYYANRARILALQENYKRANQDIDKAIEIEPFDDHTLWRVNSYDEIRIKILFQQRSTEMKQQADQMKKEQERARTQLASVRGETLTLLGLLAAVIAFVVSSVQLMSDLQSVETGLLMTIMAGLLLVVFGAFMELIQPGERWRKKSTWVVVIGVLIVALAGLVLWLGAIPG